MRRVLFFIFLFCSPAFGQTNLLGGVPFSLSGGYSFVGTLTGNTTVTFPTSGTLLASGGALGTPSSGTLTNCTFPTLNQNTTGSAATLTTPRTINGTSFNGSANITVTAAAGTLTGTTLNSTVITSSLTSVGTVGTGVWQGTPVVVTYGGTGRATLTNHGVLIGAGTAAITQLAVPAAGQLLTSVATADPAWSATPTLGIAGTTTGQLKFANATGANVITVAAPASPSAYTFTLPSSGGTNLYFLQTNGSGTTSWAAVSAGLSFITETLNSSSPNGTVNIEELAVSGGSTNNDLALVPSGQGAFTTHVADGTSTGGNKLGAYAVDLQGLRSDAAQAATGHYASIIGGRNNTASAAYSVAMGNQATADKLGQFAFSSIGIGVVSGTPGQMSIMTPGNSTSDATANVALFLDGTFTNMTIPSNTAWVFTGSVIGKTSATANYSCWTFVGSAVNNGGTITVNGVTFTSVNDGLTLNATPPNILAIAGSGIKIVVTGLAATTIVWGSTIYVTEINF